MSSEAEFFLVQMRRDVTKSVAFDRLQGSIHQPDSEKFALALHSSLIQPCVEPLYLDD